MLPIEAGFVGADNVGVLIAEEPYNQDEMVLIIDIGTNGELLMGNRNKVCSTSCATGPAFEGAQIKFGMRAAPGAIETVEIDPKTREPRYKVIGKADWHTHIEKVNAKGLCGSAIIEVVAEMFKAGIIDKCGRFVMDLGTPRVRKDVDGKPEYVLAWASETSIGQDITITQGDVRALQLAKGALYTGAKLMMKRLGIAKLDRVILAGAFGSHIDSEASHDARHVPGLPHRQGLRRGQRGRRRLAHGAPEPGQAARSERTGALGRVRRDRHGPGLREGVHAGHAHPAHEGQVPEPEGAPREEGEHGGDQGMSPIADFGLRNAE